MLAEELSRRGISADVSVATPLGAEELAGLPGITPLVGRLDLPEMERLVTRYDKCVDATHPYAQIVSHNIRTACASVQVPLRRLLRGESGDFDGVRVDSPEEAAGFLERKSGNVLLAIGAKGLSAFAHLEPHRLYPRVLPVEESLHACRQARIPTRNILALHGPFSQELNEAVLRQYHIRWMVTKEGGTAGGFEEKVAAARSTGTTLVVIGRPVETGDSFETVLHWLLEDVST